MKLEAGSDIASSSPARPLLGELEILRAFGRVDSLTEIGRQVCECLEQQFTDCRASVLALDPATRTLELVAAPGLPESYKCLLHRAYVGPDGGACSQSAFGGRPIVTPDIREDSGWAGFLDIAQRHQFVAAWSWPLCDTDGAVLGTIGLYFSEIRDITEPEREVMERWASFFAPLMDQRLRDQKRRSRMEQWEELLDSSRVVLLECDDDGRVTELRCGASSEDAESFEHLQGAVLAEAVESSERSQFEEAMAQAMETGDPVYLDAVALRIDGDRYWWQISASPTPSLDGSASGLLVMAMDITGTRRLRHQIAHNARIQSLNNFAAGVAHEINNPLGYIGANADFIQAQLRRREAGQSSSDLGEVLEALDDVKTGVSRIQTIVADLNAYTSENDRRGSLSVSDAIDTMLDLLKIEVGDDFEVELSLQDGLSVFGNETRFLQVLLNPCQNAVRAMREGGKPPHRLSISSRLANSRVTIEIEDNGPGMSAEVRQQIFDAFFTTHPADEGTGLGLAIVKDIVEEMNGTATVDSTVDEGTTFCLEFPEAESAGERQLDQGLVLDRRLAILIVDDDPLLIAALRRMVGDAHDLEFAHSADEALGHLESHDDFDAVLVDLMMPDIDGVQFVQRLGVELPHLVERVAFITGGITDESVRQYLQSVETPLYYKPFDRQKFEDLLAKLL